MKRSLFQLGLVLCLLAGLVGCAQPIVGTGPGGSLTDAEFELSLASQAQEVKAGVSIATTTILLTQKEADRRETGAFAYNLAKAVEKTAADGTVDLAKVKSLAKDVIDNSKVKNKELVGYLLNVTSDVIASRISGRMGSLTESRKVTAARALLKAAAEGVIQATQPYAPPITSVVPANDAWRHEPYALKWLFVYPPRVEGWS